MRRLGPIVLLLASCMAWPDTPPGSDTSTSGDDQSAEGPGCPTVCSNDCAGGVCKVQCDTSGCVCPPGLACEVSCGGTGSCGGEIDCAQAKDCKVICSGQDSCTGKITCGSGPCDVDCSGTNACAAGVDCSASCGCSVQGVPPGQVHCPPFCKTGCAPADKCGKCK